MEALVRPVVELHGLELVEVTFRKEAGRRILRVTVDREGGVDLDTISSASEKISRRLDLEEVASGPYQLEVSSPGIERPLRTRRDFERKVGEQVKVKTKEPEVVVRTGKLASANERGIVLSGEDWENSFSYEQIASARVVFDWSDS